jgi:hypothetical protein
MITSYDLESVFDPSDLNAASGVAVASLKLMRLAQLVIETDDKGLLMGRDQKSDLSVAILECARELGLLNSWASAEEIDRFRNNLKE